MADVYLRSTAEGINLGYGNDGTPRERAGLITDAAQEELERHGVKVYRGGADIDNATAVARANQIQPDAYVSVGMNQGDGKTAGGAVDYRIPSEPLAHVMSARLEDVTPTKTYMGLEENYSRDRGAQYELRNVTVPATQISVGDSNNSEDNRFMREHAFELGSAIARGILQYLDIAYRPLSDRENAAMRAKYNNASFIHP